MADLSNRALALLLVVAIVVSIAGTITSITRTERGFSPTGLAISNDTGTTTFSITANFSIRFANALLPFGTGTVIGGGPCELGTNNSPPASDANCNGFNATLHEANLTIENDGNIRANVSLNFSQVAADLIGGTGPSLQYRAANIEEANSCASFWNGSSWQEVASGPNAEVNKSGVRVCNDLNFTDSRDQFDIGIWMLIPENAPTGGRTLTIWALGCDDGSC